MMQSKFFKGCLAIICLLTIVLLISKVSFIFIPIVLLIRLLILPVTISVFLYYLLRPIVKLADHRNINRVISILVIYLLIAGLFTLFLIVVWPPLRTQIESFIGNLPQLVESIQHQITVLQENPYIAKISSDNPDITNKITEYINAGIENISNYVSHFLSLLNNIVVIIGTVPILLYYLLKQDNRITPAASKIVPKRYRRDSEQVIKELDSALSGFISGRMLSSLLLAVMFLIGFLIIGLPYTLLLAIVGAAFNLIPYFGALLGSIPTIIVAFTVSPSMVLWVIIIIIIAQQIEGNVISPYIYGKTINIHPVTTIVLLLLAGDFAGILGMLLCIPIYVMVKIIVVRVYKLFMAQKVEEMID